MPYRNWFDIVCTFLESVIGIRQTGKILIGLFVDRVSYQKFFCRYKILKRKLRFLIYLVTKDNNTIYIFNKLTLLKFTNKSKIYGRIIAMQQFGDRSRGVRSANGSINLTPATGV